MPRSETFSSGGSALGISVIEVTIVTPNMICVSVEDEQPIAGHFVDTGSDQGTVTNEWIAKASPLPGGPNFAKVLGPDQHGLLFSSRRPSKYVDREPARLAANWQIVDHAIGVTDVFYENDLFHECSWSVRGDNSNPSDVMPANAWLHHFYLKLSGKLASGQRYRIRPPTDWAVQDVIFDYDDRVTRAKPLKASFAGWRPNDKSKIAFLSQWVPGEANEGALNLRAFGFTKFEIIDESGATVWEDGSIPAGKDPTQPENRELFPAAVPGTNNHRLRLYPSSMAASRLRVVSVSGTVPATVELARGDGAKIVNDDILYVGYLPTTNGSEMSGLGRWCKVSAKSGDRFVALKFDGNANNFVPSNINFETFEPSAMAGPTVSALYKTHLADSAMTWVHQLDFSAFVGGNGKYRLRIPGLGVSDVFPVSENAWHAAAGHLAKGEFHNRCGCKIDGRFGYERDWSFRHGKRGVVFHRSNLPSVFSLQGGIIPGERIDYGGALVHPSSWTTDAEIDAGGEWFDAGDWDVFPSQHLESAYQAMFVYERLHEINPASVDTDWNIPLSSDPNMGLGSDIDQSELDSLPDILHQVHYALDWARRCQMRDGSCPSGIQNRYEAFVANPVIGQIPEVSVAALSPYWTYAADHPTNFEFAGLFAQFGRILLASGCPKAGNAYVAAAKAAWNWAEDIFRKLAVDTSPTTMSIGGGSKSFTLQSGQAFPAHIGESIRIQSRSNETNFIEGIVTKATSPNFFLNLTIKVTAFGGSGTFGDWDVTMGYHDPYYYYDALTGVRRQTTVTGNTQAGVPAIAGLSSVKGLRVGDHVTGAGIRDRMRVKSIDSSTQITLEAIDNSYDTTGRLLHDPIPAGATSTASNVSFSFRCYQGGWSDTKYLTNLASVQGQAKAYRQYAAISLFKATNDPAMRDIYERTHLSGNGFGFDLYAMCEYLGPAPFKGVEGANASIVEGRKEAILNDAKTLAKIVEAETAGYKNMGSRVMNYTSHVYGARVLNILAGPFLASTAADRERHRNVLLSLMGHIFGANHMGQSWSVGFGPRFKRNMMHIDSQRLHPEGRTADGLVPYGCNFNPEFALAISFLSWSDTIPLSSLHHAYSPGESEFRRNQIAEPGRFFRSGHYSFDTRHQVNESEFGMPNVIVNQLIALILHGWDGNSKT
jgi:hypothetical protein